MTHLFLTYVRNNTDFVYNCTYVGYCTSTITVLVCVSKVEAILKYSDVKTLHFCANGSTKLLAKYITCIFIDYSNILLVFLLIIQIYYLYFY